MARGGRSGNPTNLSRVFRVPKIGFFGFPKTQVLKTATEICPKYWKPDNSGSGTPELHDFCSSTSHHNFRDQNLDK
uniref:Uncharacterized protein n=1 Tax=Setaria italica TaxID=4555 RepID=K3ZBF3_SETIT